MNTSIVRAGSCVAAALLLLSSFSAAQRRPNAGAKPVNGPIVIGRRTYFDFGPPFEFYEIFVVEPESVGLSVERLRLTPPGHVCLQPAQIEIASTTINETVSDLLAGADPCAIPEKALRRELKRCKHCLRFSGADLMMQVTCGDQARRIRMDILDRDLFDKASHPPQHTSWLLAFLQRLDGALGDTVMDKPAFSTGQLSRSALSRGDQLNHVIALSQGAFDPLFPDGSQKPSAIYIDSMKPPVRPTVVLIERPSLESAAFSAPDYPPLARAAHIQGRVAFSVNIDDAGAVAGVNVASGHPLLKGSVEAEARKWKFPADATGKTFKFVMEFRTNCPEQK